jgi:hypothetical protein
MENDVLALFTTKSAQACLDVGGTQSWALNPDNAKKCRYAVLFRNPDADWGGKELHNMAFMIGRISPVVPSTERPDRWMLTFDEYAIIDKPGVRKRWRNPVRYTTFAKLGISLAEIKFRPMPRRDIESEATSLSKAGTPTRIDIDTAKKGLAAYYNVSPEAVEITIRG